MSVILSSSCCLGICPAIILFTFVVSGLGGVYRSGGTSLWWSLVCLSTSLGSWGVGEKGGIILEWEHVLSWSRTGVCLRGMASRDACPWLVGRGGCVVGLSGGAGSAGPSGCVYTSFCCRGALRFVGENVRNRYSHLLGISPCYSPIHGLDWVKGAHMNKITLVK